MNDADLFPDRPGNIFISSDQAVKIGGVLAATRREKRKENLSWAWRRPNSDIGEDKRTTVSNHASLQGHN